jgi:hypothetical protein
MSGVAMMSMVRRSAAAISLGGATAFALVVAFLAVDAGAGDRVHDRNRSVIFTAEQAAVIASSGDLALFPLSPPFWTPDAALADAAESALARYLSSQGYRASQVLEQWPKYNLQFLGYTEGGTRWLVINAFCAESLKHEDAWRRAFVVVIDGGTCFFHVRYDPRGGRFDSLYINRNP